MEFSSLAGHGPGQLDFDDLYLEELISMLNSIALEDILDDFGTQFLGGKEDPVIHLYETFLSHYDNERRFERGVFYTPKPVVKQMVDDVHQELITKFGLKLGLADCSTYKSDGRTHYTVTILILLLEQELSLRKPYVKFIKL